MLINITSENVAYWEETNDNIYTAINKRKMTTTAYNLLTIATGKFGKEDKSEVYGYLDELKKEHGGVRGVVDYLLDLFDEEGFFPQLTAAQVKQLLDTEREQMVKQEMLSEEEKEKAKTVAVQQALEKLIETQKKTNGGNGGKSKK